MRIRLAALQSAHSFCVLQFPSSAVFFVFSILSFWFSQFLASQPIVALVLNCLSFLDFLVLSFLSSQFSQFLVFLVPSFCSQQSLSKLVLCYVHPQFLSFPQILVSLVLSLYSSSFPQSSIFLIRFVPSYIHPQFSDLGFLTDQSLVLSLLDSCIPVDLSIIRP